MTRIVHCHPPHWPRLRNALAPFFDHIKTPGHWYSKRLGLELIKASEISNKRKAAAEQMHKKRKGFAYGEHRQSHSQSSTKTVNVSTQSIGQPARAGSDGPLAGIAQIGERMGDFVWDGTHWAEAKERPFGTPP
jgi:hypothetical protein